MNNLNKRLNDAIKLGDLENVKYLVKQGVDIHRENDIALSLASQNRHLDVVKYLVERGADINISFAFVVAVKNGHLDVVKYLVEHGADIHVLNDYSLRNPDGIYYLDIVKYLVEENGFDVYITNNINERLENSIIFGDLDGVKYLVEHGADIHANNEIGLQWASSAGRIEIVKYLVENGADIHVNNDIILQQAYSAGHFNVVKYLIEQGANMNVIANDEPSESIFTNKYLHLDDV